MSAPPPVGRAQTNPVSQVPPLPPQQGSPEPPQAVHIPAPAPVQSAPSWQVPPGQQAAPTAPQAMQVRVAVVLPAHTKPVAQADVPGQQPSPLAPHGSQELAPPVTAWHDSPEAQASAPVPQQASFTAPHTMHVPGMFPVPRMHTAPAPVQVSPPVAVGQQSSPTAPQGLPPDWHEPFMHMPRVVMPLRQVVPLPTQVPPTQQPPLRQLLVAQHA